MTTARILPQLAAALALSLAAPLAAQAAEGRLVLYTSQPNADAQATVDAFTAAYPDVEVEWVRDGTTQMMARLATEFEAGNPQPDLLLIADTVTMEGLKQEGRLMAHPDADTSAYADGLMDPEGFYFSTKLITTGIVYNTAAPFVPERWLDLLNEEAEGQVRIPSPLTGSVDGLMVYDSEAGRSLASRFGATNGWEQFTMYRGASRSGQIHLTFELTGLGEVWIDDVTIEPMAPQVPSSTPTFGPPPIDSAAMGRRLLQQ